MLESTVDFVVLSVTIVSAKAVITIVGNINATSKAATQMYRLLFLIFIIKKP